MSSRSQYPCVVFGLTLIYSIISCNSALAEAASSQAAVGAVVRAYDPSVKRRIVFTSWYLINSGWFTWEDEKGAVVDMKSDADPMSLHLNLNNGAFGIRLTAQPASDRVKIDTPALLSTILYDEGKYKGWGSIDEKAGVQSGIATLNGSLAYLESTDGYHWKCLDSETVFRKGSTKHVFIDPSAPSSERYKMVIDYYPKGIGGAVSADGIHWTEFPDLILEDDADSQNIGYYDAELKKYVLYHRARRGKTAREFGMRWARRAIARTESVDFRKFPPSEIILDGHDPQLPPNVDLYMNCRTTIPGAPELHLMFPTLYHHDTDSTSVYLAGSVDGKFWNYVPGGAVITTNTFGREDGGCLFNGPDLVELPDGSFGLHYGGYNIPHKYPRGQMQRGDYYAIWPKGRLIALEAPEHGRFAMVPIPMTGKRLRINAITTRSGNIKVEIMQNLEKKMLTEPPAVEGYSFQDCDMITGDQYQKVVQWNGKSEIPIPPGEPLILRFELNHAKLFGLDLSE